MIGFLSLVVFDMETGIFSIIGLVANALIVDNVIDNIGIDYKVSGIGSNSCGSELGQKYRLDEKEFEYTFSVKLE